MNRNNGNNVDSNTGTQLKLDAVLDGLSLLLPAVAEVLEENETIAKMIDDLFRIQTVILHRLNSKDHRTVRRMARLASRVHVRCGPDGRKNGRTKTMSFGR